MLRKTIGWCGLFVGCSLAACASKNNGAPAGPCVADDLEPNESPRDRKLLGVIQDDPPLTGDSGPPKRVEHALSLHDGADIDWLDVDVRDTGVLGSPKVSVFVDGGLEATAFFDCTRGTTGPLTCGVGSMVANDPDLPQSKGCVTKAGSSDIPSQFTMKLDCGGSDASGFMHVRVRRITAADACLKYSITVSAE